MDIYHSNAHLVYIWSCRWIDSLRNDAKALQCKYCILGLWVLNDLFIFQSSLANYKELHKFEGGNHNFTWKCAQYYPTIVNFLQIIFKKSHFAPQVPPDLNHDHAGGPSVDEKSPLISEEEFHLLPASSSDLASVGEQQLPSSNSMVKYHSQDNCDLVEQSDSLANPNYEETNGQLLQLLDTGYSQVVIAIDGTKKYAELVDI